MQNDYIVVCYAQQQCRRLATQRKRYKRMSRIKISNFGPIHTPANESEAWIDVKKVTVFIGDQGCGKSTIAKLISLCCWMEKVLARGDFNKEVFTASKFRDDYCGYHRMTNYFKLGRTEIEYEGDAYSLKYTKAGDLVIEKMADATRYPLPQIAYIPAERSLISTINKPSLIKGLPGSLSEFLTEYERAKGILVNELELPINGALLDYDQQSDILSIKGDDYKLRLQESASGFQSVVPLFLVSKHLSDIVSKQAKQSNSMSGEEVRRFQESVASIWNGVDLTDEQRRIALSTLAAKFNKAAFVNIVEEPEQNLYPSSQMLLLQSLLQFNNALDANKLIITTHSPYLVNHLAVAVKAHTLNNAHEDIAERIEEIYPLDAAVAPDDLAIYQHDANDNYFYALEQYKGIPSDDNLLNVHLDESNDKFASLLEIEQRV